MRALREDRARHRRDRRAAGAGRAPCAWTSAGARPSAAQPSGPRRGLGDGRRAYGAAGGRGVGPVGASTSDHRLEADELRLEPHDDVLHRPGQHEHPDDERAAPPPTRLDRPAGGGAATSRARRGSRPPAMSEEGHAEPERVGQREEHARGRRRRRRRPSGLSRARIARGSGRCRAPSRGRRPHPSSGAPSRPAAGAPAGATVRCEPTRSPTPRKTRREDDDHRPADAGEQVEVLAQGAARQRETTTPRADEDDREPEHEEQRRRARAATDGAPAATRRTAR